MWIMICWWCWTLKQKEDFEGYNWNNLTVNFNTTEQNDVFWMDKFIEDLRWVNDELIEVVQSVPINGAVTYGSISFNWMIWRPSPESSVDTTL